MATGKPRPQDNGSMIDLMDTYLRKNIVNATQTINATFQVINPNINIDQRGQKLHGKDWIADQQLTEKEINSFFIKEEPSQIDIDCIAATVLIMAKGLIDTLNAPEFFVQPGEFDALGYHPLLRNRVVDVDMHLKEVYPQTIDQMKVGDWGYFANNEWYATTHPVSADFAGENVIKVGINRKGESMFYGFPSKYPQMYWQWIEMLLNAYKRDFLVQSSVLNLIDKNIPLPEEITAKDIPGFNPKVYPTYFFDVTQIWQDVKNLRHNR